MSTPAEGLARFYHLTSWERACRILAEGFKDGSTTTVFSSDGSHPETVGPGVWLRDKPEAGMMAGKVEGARIDTVLTVDIALALVRDHEWVRDGLWPGDWLVPAAVLNAAATVGIHGRA